MLNRQTKNRGRTRTDRRSGRPHAGLLITAGVIAGLTSVPALAGPQGENVTHGKARFQRNGAHTKITTSNKAIINYDSFNLSKGESVRFVQPGANSRVLNRIQSSAPTHINGRIDANGNIYFVNPSGIMFGRDSVLNVGTLYAAAGSITNADFLNNVNRFTGLDGEVVNRGQINAQRAAHLVGRRVANFGQVVAPDGMITFTAGDDVLIGQRGGRVFARIDGSPGSNGGVDNHGVIDAGTGQVLAGVGDHFALAIYGGSEITGSSVRMVGGRGSAVRVGGTVDASNATGRGGEIDVLGGKVAIDGATLDASGATGGGQIHIGGDYQGEGSRLRSDATLVTEGSTLNVDATGRGNAGTAIVWSDGATMFYGDISAKGVRKGGFAEVSGKGYLDFDGSFDLTGPIANGTLLLDPTNIFVVDGPDDAGFNEADVDNFIATDLNVGAMRTEITDATLSRWLDDAAGGDVILKANNDILFRNGVQVSQLTESHALDLEAGRRIVFLGGSSLVMNGDLRARANTSSGDLVGADRSGGLGSFIARDGSTIQSGGTVDVIVDAAGAEAGSIFLQGDLQATRLVLSAADASSRIIFEDNIAGAGHAGSGAALEATAGDHVRFRGNTGDWVFDSATFTGTPLVRFDADSTGITASGGSLDFNPAGDAGTSIQIDNATAFAFGGTTNLSSGIDSAGDLTFSDAVVITGSGVEIDAPSVTFDSLLDSEGAEGNGLTLTLNGGLATFNGEVGSTELALGMGSVMIDGDLALNAGLRATGDVTVTGATEVANDPTIQLFAGSALTFTGDVNSATGSDLTIVTGFGPVSFDSAVGAANPLGTLGVTGADGTLTFASTLAAGLLDADMGTAGVINLGGATLTGVGGTALDLTAGPDGIALGGDLTLGGDSTFNTSVALGGPIAIDMLGASSLMFDGTVNGAGTDLVITLGTGNATFNAAVGDATPLGTINVTGTGGTLAMNAGLFAGLLDADMGATGDISLAGATLTGVGGTALDLTAGPATITLNGDLSLGANAMFNSAVVLGNGITIDMLGGSTLTFDGTVNSSGAGESLTVEMSGGSAFFLDEVGGADALGTIDINGFATTVRFASPVAAGSLLVGDLGGGSSPDRVVINDTVTAVSDIELAYTDQLVLGTLDAPTVSITGIGTNLIFRAPDNIGASVDELNLTTLGSGRIVLVGTQAGDLDVGVSEVSLDSAQSIIVTGPTANWDFRDISFSAADTIVFATMTESVDWRQSLGGGLAFDAGAGRISAGGDFAFGEIAGADAGYTFTIANDVIGAGSLTVDRDALLSLNGDAVRNIRMVGGGELAFNGTLASLAGEGAGLDVELRDGGGALFAGQVGDGTTGRLGDINIVSTGGVIGVTTALEFGGDVFADSLTSLSGQGDVILGGATTDLVGDNGAGFSLDLAAADSTIEIHGNLVMGLSALFQTNVELHGGGSRNITMNGAGSTLTFQGDVLADAGSVTGLTVTLNNSDPGTGVFTTAVFEGFAGGPLNDRLGVIGLVGPGSVVDFQSDVHGLALFAGTNTNRLETLTIGSAAGTSVASFNLNFPTVNGVDVFAGLIQQNSDMTAFNSGIRFTGPVELRGDVTTSGVPSDIVFRDGVEVFGDRTVSLVDGDMMFSVEAGGASIPVLLQSDAMNGATGDSRLTLITDNGGMILQDVDGESVQRAGTGFAAEFIVRSADGSIDTASIGETRGRLDMIDIDLDTDLDVSPAGGAAALFGDRYLADQVLINADGGTFLVFTNPTDHSGAVTFGDDGTALTGNVRIESGPMNVFGGIETVNLNALVADGDVRLYGATRTDATTDLFLRSNGGVVSIGDPGAGGSIGVGGALFDIVEIDSFGVDVLGPVFAENLFFNPNNNVLSFNGDQTNPAGIVGMIIDGTEVATLNLGQVTNLFLGHNDPATATAFSGAGGMTFLFGGPTPDSVPLLIGSNVSVFGETFVSGVFESAIADAGTLDFFGATEFRDASGLNASFAGRDIRFFDSLRVASAGSIMTAGGDVSFINADPDGGVPGVGTDGLAEIFGVGAGTFDLAIDAGAGTVSLFHVGAMNALGDAQMLTSFGVDADTINFNGRVYDAVTQSYTADVYNMLGAPAGFAPGSVRFYGTDLAFNDAGLGMNRIVLADGIDMSANLTASGGQNASFVSDAFFVGTGNQSLRLTARGADGRIELNRAAGWNGVGLIDAAPAGEFLGSVDLSGQDILVSPVFTSGTQLFRNAQSITLMGDRYRSDSADPAATAIEFRGNTLNLMPAGGEAFVSAPDGTILFDVAQIDGAGNALRVEAGPGSIDFRVGIDIDDAAQMYTAAAYNFLGSATLSSDQPASSIVFAGGTLNLGGQFDVTTNGAGSNISLADTINLGGRLNASALGAGSDVLVGILNGTGSENVSLIATDLVSVAGSNGPGAGSGLNLLDIEAGSLAINGPTSAGFVRIVSQDRTRDIAVGNARAGTLNITNADLANLGGFTPGANLLVIGEQGFGQRIFVDNAMLNRATGLLADGAGGVVEFLGNGVAGVDGLDRFRVTAGEIQLGAVVRSDGGPFDVAFVGPTDVIGTDAQILSGGGGVRIVGPINGEVGGMGDLLIDTAGGQLSLTVADANGLVPIGRDRALNSVAMLGSPSLTLAGARTRGDQSFQASGGQTVVLAGSEFRSNAGGEQFFGGPVETRGDALFRATGPDGSSAVTFIGPVSGSGDPADTLTVFTNNGGAVTLSGVGPGVGSLDVQRSGSLLINGPVAVLTDANLIGDAITLAGDVSAGGDVTISGNSGRAELGLTGERTISADGDLSLTANAFSDDGGSLSLESAVSTLIDGLLGRDGQRLGSFASSANGTTTFVNSGGVVTSGRAGFRNDVVVDGTTIVDSNGTSSADGVLFEQTITGSGVLSLFSNRTVGQDIIAGIPDADSARIELRGDVGGPGSSLSLLLNRGTAADGSGERGVGGVPFNAAIITGNTDTFGGPSSGQDITVQVNRLEVGAREKMLALGDLTLIGTGVSPFARLSDVTTVGDLGLFGFSEVSIFSRESAQVFLPTTNTFVFDRGTDIVSGGNMNFSGLTLTFNEGTGDNPEFGLPGGEPVGINRNDVLFRSLVVPEGQGFAGLISTQTPGGTLFVDARSDGVSNTNVAEAIAGAAPREGQTEPVTTDVVLSQAAVTFLNELQITIKQPGDAFYLVDMPVAETEQMARVSSRRLDAPLVLDLIESHDSTFQQVSASEAGDEVTTSRIADIKETIAESVDAYLEVAEEFRPEGFVNFLRQNPEAHGAALSEIERLQAIMTNARLLGLTEAELIKVKGALARDAMPGNINDRPMFDSLIDPNDTLLLGIR